MRLPAAETIALSTWSSHQDVRGSLHRLILERRLVRDETADRDAAGRGLARDRHVALAEMDLGIDDSAQSKTMPMPMPPSQEESSTVEEAFRVETEMSSTQ